MRVKENSKEPLQPKYERMTLKMRKSRLGDQKRQVFFAFHELNKNQDDKLMQMATAFMTANQMINPTLEYSPIEINDQLQELRFFAS